MLTAALAIAGAPPNPGSEVGSQAESRIGEDYTYYWILGQLPQQTDAYLYARDGASVTFDGMISSPVTIEVPPDRLMRYNVGTDIGFTTQLEGDYYFLELESDNPVMVTFNFSVLLEVDEGVFEWSYGDDIRNMPPMEFSSEYYLPLGGSGSLDDNLVVYSPEATQVTARFITNEGDEFTEIIDVEGLYISPRIARFIGEYHGGYGVELTSGTPIATTIFDEQRKWPSEFSGSGYYFSFTPRTELYDGYMHLYRSAGRRMSFYTPTANTLEFFDHNGDLVGTRTYSARTSEDITLSDVGYAGSPAPFLVDVRGSEPFGIEWVPPAELTIIDKAAYLGWSSDVATLDIFADQDARVTVYNGRDLSVLAELDMPANSLFEANVADLGFEPGEPFLVAVISDVPVHQTVIGTHHLRSYPADVGPPVIVPPPGEDLDIMPGKCPNNINPASRGKFQVSLQGTDSFDVTDVALETIQLCRADGVGGCESPLRARYKDITRPFTPDPPGDECACTKRRKKDGHVDLWFRFSTRCVVWALELYDLPGGEQVPLVLKADRIGGGAITAGDCVRINP